jgi:hypothetical protein
MDNHVKVLEMVFLTAGGWIISIQDIETVARIISLLVPATLSVLIYIKKRKDGKK